MSVPPPDQEQRPVLQPPQFGVSTLLWAMAALCVLFAILAAAGPVPASVLLLLLLAVFAHVAGNAVGTKLKDGAGHQPPSPKSPARREKLTDDQYAPATRLSEKTSLGITIFVVTLIGAALGAVIGGGLLTILNWEKIVWQAIAIGAVASGVLGGLAGFMASSFVHVIVVAHLQAWRHGRDKSAGASSDTNDPQRE